nr:envelope biogenesis factor ElyC [Candidatus Pantoea persica]
MFFALKKLVGGLMMSLLLLLIMAAGILLLWSGRWQKSGKIVVSVSWALLLCCC